MRKSGTVVRRGQEKLLVCPGDPAFERSSSLVAGIDWEALDLADPPPGLCSYAGRDFVAFPIDWSVDEKHAIGACVHHRGGVVVAFDEGDVQFVTREELGLGPDDEIRVGPDSKSPLLRTLVGGN